MSLWPGRLGSECCALPDSFMMWCPLAFPVFPFLFVAMLGTEPQVLCMLGEHSATEPDPQPVFSDFCRERGISEGTAGLGIFKPHHRSRLLSNPWPCCDNAHCRWSLRGCPLDLHCLVSTGLPLPHRGSSTQCRVCQ